LWQKMSAMLLGLASSKHVQEMVDTDEITYVSRRDLGLSPGKDMLLVNKHGVYELIFRSNKPVARKFKKWVKEVLDWIRK